MPSLFSIYLNVIETNQACLETTRMPRNTLITETGMEGAIIRILPD